MRNVIGLVVVLCLASGLIGAFAVNELAGEAGAAPGCPPKCPTPSATASPTPAPPQQREDQITMFSQSANGPSTQVTSDFADVSGQFAAALDPADYPPATIFRFEVVAGSGGNASSHCIRLFDASANAPVSGSDQCITVSASPTISYHRLRSGPLALGSGEHEYKVQGKSESLFFPDCCGIQVSAARIIAEWTE